MSPRYSAIFPVSNIALKGLSEKQLELDREQLSLVSYPVTILTSRSLDSLGHELQDCRINLEHCILEVPRSSGISIEVKMLVNCTSVNEMGSLLKAEQYLIRRLLLIQAELERTVSNWKSNLKDCLKPSKES